MSLRAAVYIRVSTERQADQGISLDAQLAACRAEALRLGDRSPAVYRDDGYSGTTDKRPGLQALLANLAEYDVVIVWRLDRLWRSVAGWARLLADMVQHEVGFCSIAERIDTSTPWGRAMLTVVAVFAELFVEILRENVRGALQYRADQGLKHGRPAYGYAARDGAWVVVDDEAAIVRELFRMVSKGASTAECTRWLQTSGAVPRTSKQGWHITSVRELLRNVAYTGRMLWHGDVIPGTHPRIIPDALWRKAQAVMDGRIFTRGHRSESIVGLFRCGFCGSCLERSQGGLTCHARRRRAVEHPPLWMRWEFCEEALWAYFTGLVSEGLLSAAVDRLRDEERSGEGRRGILNKRLRELKASEARALTLAQRTGADLDALADSLGPVIAERERLETELRSLAHKPEVDSWSALLKRHPAESIRDLRARGTAEEHLLLLRSVIARAEVHKGRLVIHHQGDILPPAEVPVRMRKPGRPKKSAQ